MRPHKLIFSGLFILLGMGLVSCEKKPKPQLTPEIHAQLDADIKGFDPLFCDDEYSYAAISQVYEGLYEYEYLKRPYTLKPLLAASMPEISEDGRTYRITLKKNIAFHPDPVWAGKKRTLTAQDVVYSFVRFADTRIKHPSWWVLQDQIEGLDELRARSAQDPQLDVYAQTVSGLTAIDDHTLEIKLRRPSQLFRYYLAMPQTMVVAREVVDQYGPEFLNHPVGTGPFQLDTWVRNQKLVFDKNPHYISSHYPRPEVAQVEKPKAAVASPTTLPLVDGLTLWVFTEQQPMWLNFLSGKLDYATIPKDAYTNTITPEGALNKKYAEQGMRVETASRLDLVLFTLNMKDPVIGQNRWLRKALSAAVNREEKIENFYNNRAIEAHGVIPPGLFGYDPDLVNPNAFDLKQAKTWMAQAKAQHTQQTGAKDFPTLTIDIPGHTHSRQVAEALMYDFAQIGVKADIRSGTFAQFSQRMNKGAGQIYLYGWNADYPDAENFLQLFYSKNQSPGPNSANFSHAEYDRLYEKIITMDDGPEKAGRMAEMQTILHQECPAILFNHRISMVLRHGWLKNYQAHAVHKGIFKYLNVDVEEKQRHLSKR